MIINEAGEYTLQYTATDACGNSTTVERDLVVEAPPRTVLYTDGTFIINELSRDINANIQAHGQPKNVYIPFDPNGATNVDKYIFNYNNMPWKDQWPHILNIEIGSEIQPTICNYWFFACSSCVNIDLSNLDTSLVTSMESMFANMLVLTSIDISNFDTSNVTNMAQMFGNCNHLETIYASNSFVTDQVDSSSGMFQNMSTNLVGGAGTVWSGSYTDKTRAKIDGGTSNPGYFTAKS